MVVYRTKGAVRRRVKALARIAGLTETPLIGFSRAELERLSPGCLMGHRKNLCTQRDDCWARAWHSRNLIWVSLPTSDDTLAHEVNHLRTKASHNSALFNNQVVALSRGLDPRKAKPKLYDVTIVTKEVRRVFELSPSMAKKRANSGSLLRPVERKITARQTKARR